MEVRIGKTILRLVTGDIAEQDTDAVVTAAHWRLNKGNGTDGTIHSKGGPKIYEECRRIGGCPIGDAVITTGGDRLWERLRLRTNPPLSPELVTRFYFTFRNGSGLLCRVGQEWGRNPDLISPGSFEWPGMLFDT